MKQMLSNLISAGPLPVPPPVAPHTPTPHVHTVAGPCLKPATPNEFNCARDKGRAFLNSCKLYMHLVLQQFADAATCIRWTLSFMKQDRTSLFADHTLCHQGKHGILLYRDWAAFPPNLLTCSVHGTRGRMHSHGWKRRTFNKDGNPRMSTLMNSVASLNLLGTWKVLSLS